MLASKYSVSEIGIFGSMVRNDFTADSDIDIIVAFSRPVGIEFIDLANELEHLFDRRIDLVSRTGVKPSYMQRIQPEIIYV